MREGRLVASSNSGRYALDDPLEGPDLTSGQAIEVKLGDRWINGSIEHGGKLYASESSHRAEAGYYFIARDGSVCGLCVGMEVRIP